MDESILTKEGLSYDSSEFNDIAKDIQGNILKGHARDHVTLLFFTFDSGKVNEAKTWLHTFGTTDLTTAKKQKEQALKFRETNEQTFFFGLYLSASCYEYLGLDAIKPNDFLPGKAMTDPSVMADLEDPPVSEWEEDWQKPIHGCLLIAYGGYKDDRTKLDLMSLSLKKDLDAFGYSFIQKGDSLKNGKINIEHFGYADGISQPQFFVEELDALNPNNFSTWHPMALLNLALVPDNYNSFGSYWVFRKLQQNVQAFKENEAAIAKSQGLEGEESEIVGARIVGRFENGMPIAVSQEEDEIKGIVITETGASQINNFNYPAGSPCPVHAHIRKVNKRTKGFPRIVRRGIPYDERKDKKPENEEDTQVGLLFQCFQSNIENQFEAIQKTANEAPKDLIIGCPKDNKYVKLKGGGYFFAPSRLFFESLNPISSQRNLIADMKKGIVGQITTNGKTSRVYYSSMVSLFIIKQLRNEIEEAVQTELDSNNRSGTRNQVIEILTSGKTELLTKLTKAHNLHEWYKSKHENAGVSLEDHNLQGGGDFDFIANENNEHGKNGDIVKGSTPIICADGICCASESDNAYFMVESSTIPDTSDKTAIKEVTETDDGLWHIYETKKNTPFTINIAGENYAFTT